MRKAKIIATIGPSSSSIDQIEKLILSGMNAARINMSHGTHEGHSEVIKNIREVSKKLGQEVAILLDLQGPKIRVDKLEENLTLKNDEIWYIGQKKFKADYKNYIPTVYENLVHDVHVGANVLFDDGLLEAEVTEKLGNLVAIKVKQGGVLKSNKGINLPFVDVSAPSMTTKDEKDLYFGLENGVDYIALSFVRRAKDILDVKHLLHSMKVHIPIVSKIEKPEALDNIDEIIRVSDVIMIARGDLGVEVGNHLVPSIQKELILKCNSLGKPVITATQMLESMIQNARPTRAEASDVANAIWDGTDVVMLSGETAAGDHPIKAIKMMDQIVTEAEMTPRERPLLRNMNLNSISSSIQIAASLIAEKNDAKWVVSVTQSGNSCLKMTRFRSKAKVLGVTNRLSVMRKMSLYWGITPFYFSDTQNDMVNLENKMVQKLKEESLVQNGDKIIITHGDGSYFQHESSNTVRVEIVKDMVEKFDKDSEDFLDEAISEKGRILLDTRLCSSCQHCITICPHDIFETSKDQNRKTYINKDNMVNCAYDMECVSACPTGAIEIIEKN